MTATPDVLPRSAICNPTQGHTDSRGYWPRGPPSVTRSNAVTDQSGLGLAIPAQYTPARSPPLCKWPHLSTYTGGTAPQCAFRAMNRPGPAG